VGNPLDIQQEGVTPVSTVIRAATGIVTLCTVDVVVVWVWPTILLRILQKSHTVRAQAVFGWSQITSLLTSLSCQKLTDVIKNNDISELHHPLEKVWNYCTIYSIARTHSCTLYVHQGWIYKLLDGEGTL